jgi:hypothetical protein
VGTGVLASDAAWAAAVSPAIVEMMPLVSTLRMRLLSLSAMNRSPAESTATPSGVLSWASVARPPSPPYFLAWEVPATVEIVIGLAARSTLRIMLFPLSARYSWSPAAMNIDLGNLRPEPSAGQVAALLGQGGAFGSPVPAMVVTVPEAASTLRSRWLLLSAM